MRVVVVDNASTDGSPDLARDWPLVELIETGSNLGFGKAANIGLRMTAGEFVLLLNPDTVVWPGALAACVNALRARPDAGVLGCKLLKNDGTLDHACKRDLPTLSSALAYFFRLARIRRFGGSETYTADRLGDDEEGNVGAVNGAFMLVRRSAMEQVGYFDERYWMYGEDLDWCLRFSQRGWRVVYWPGAVVTHVKAGVTGRRGVRINFAFHNAMWIFYQTHHSERHAAIVNALVWSGIWGKFLASVTVNYAAVSRVNVVRAFVR
jgi:hypothetical protein